MLGIRLGLGVNRNRATTGVTPNIFEAEYNAFLSYITDNGYDLPNSIQQQKDNNKIKYLKEVGAWDELDKVHILNATYTPSSFEKNCYRLNWKNPGTYTLTAVSGKEPTWVSGSGFKAVGGSGNYLKTGFVPSVNGVNMKADSASEIIGTFDIPTTFSVANYWYGGRVANDTAQTLIGNSASGAMISRVTTNGATFYLSSQANINGHFHTYRSGSNYRVVRNGVFLATGTTSATGLLPTVEQYLLGYNSNGSFAGNSVDTGIKYELTGSDMRLLTSEIYNILNETYEGRKGAWTWFGRPNWAQSGTKYWLGTTAPTPDGYTQHVTQYDSSDDSQVLTRVGTQYQTDDHNQSQLLIRASDNRIIAFFVEHNGDKIRWKISTNPLDSTEWGSVKEFNPLQYYSYVSPYQNSDGDIFIFFRCNAGGGVLKWYYSKSTDDGDSFASPVEIIDNGWTQNYCITCQDGDNIHFVSSTGHPMHLGEGNISLYHFYFDMDAETFHKSDGTSITAPFAVSGATPSVITTGNDTSWNLDIVIKDGKPRILYVLYPDGRTTDWLEKELWFIEWNGTAWVNKTKISDTMSGYIEQDVSVAELCYTGVPRFVVGKPDILIMPKHIDGVLELHKVDISDLGAISIEQLTFDSDVDNWRPICLDFPKNNLIYLKNKKYNSFNDFEIIVKYKTLSL